MATTLTSKQYDGQCKAEEKDGNQETCGKEVWRKRRGWLAPGTAAGGQQQQQKTELDGDNWSVVMCHWE